MHTFANKQILVIGCGASGRAAARLLRQRGAQVMAVDNADTAELRREAEELQALGVIVELGLTNPPARLFDLAVLSPGVPADHRLVRQMRERSVPVISELELGYQEALCLNVAITGTNGKTTTT
ncbi:MAG: UDP-N-acetylmuramoyl-L-alanine--D-glutamate ligase, partial [Pedosphaera parvula]|nr:UDP-N-acetylmuramoyl-L-alanine--D-glutamate ligase [Pedosphaera parvula]